MRPRHAISALACLAATGLGGCLFTDPIGDPRQQGNDSPPAIEVTGCVPHPRDPVLLAEPYGQVEFGCRIDDAARVRWYLYVDGVERVVHQADGNDADTFVLDRSQLPEPLPETLSVNLEAEGTLANLTVRWPIEVVR
ncbi:hypothetical protein L6R50_11555 [Myxococcota bacterium]|nr:hypothetical protein [Myxococcota bacterium]